MKHGSELGQASKSQDMQPKRCDNHYCERAKDCAAKTMRAWDTGSKSKMKHGTKQPIKQAIRIGKGVTEAKRTICPVCGAKQMEIETVTLERVSMNCLSTTPNIMSKTFVKTEK